mgnify:CR=1 FL=1
MGKKKCDACELDASEITQDEESYMMSSLKDWTIIKDHGIKKAQRLFVFKNFQKAIAFTNEIAQLAEKYNHHPAILTEWGKVTITWWSHGIAGLTLKDLDMAGGCDKIFQNNS